MHGFSPARIIAEDSENVVSPQLMTNSAGSTDRDRVEEIPGIGECVGAHQITKSQRGCKSRENVGVRRARHQVRGVGWHFVERALI